ncbi:transposase [Deinococcus aerolatus]|uniref:transposase n=1 Tax=Deinococcus aerolatus TaxID=522487 RepID=UPI003570E52B
MTFHSQKIRILISVRFARRDCLHCPVRQRCTRNVSGHARELTLMPRELFEARTAQREAPAAPSRRP